jgi:hypothetical protein
VEKSNSQSGWTRLKARLHYAISDRNILRLCQLAKHMGHHEVRFLTLRSGSIGRVLVLSVGSFFLRVNLAILIVLYYKKAESGHDQSPSSQFVRANVPNQVFDPISRFHGPRSRFWKFVHCLEKTDPRWAGFLIKKTILQEATCTILDYIPV